MIIVSELLKRTGILLSWTVSIPYCHLMGDVMEIVEY